MRSTFSLIRKRRREGDNPMSIKSFKRLLAAQIREEEIKRLGREFLVYLVFLLLLGTIMIGNAQIPMAAEISMALNAAIIGEQYNAADSHVPKTFDDIMNPGDFWAFVNGPLIGTLSSGTFYSVGSVTKAKTNAEKGAVYRYNKLIGPMRLRQLRVRQCGDGPGDKVTSEAGACKSTGIGTTNPSYCPTSKGTYQPVSHTISPSINDTNRDWCFPHYMQKASNPSENFDGDYSTDSTEPYGPGNAWVYQATNAPGRYGNIARYGLGRGTKYPGQGFVYDFRPSTMATWGDEVTALMAGKWIDWQTRVVFIDFATYNPTYNLVAQCHIMVEFAATGFAYRRVEVQLFPVYTNGEFGYDTQRWLLFTVTVLTAGLFIDWIEQCYEKLKFFVYRNKVRGCIYPLAFMYAKRNALAHLTSDEVFPIK